jgi:hypothetical protein
MREFFEVAAPSPTTQHLDTDWNDRVGDRVVATLRGQGILESVGTHSHFSCDSCLRHCARKVERNTLSTARSSHVAYCQNTEEPGCDEVEVNEAQLQASRVALPALLQFLQAKLNLKITAPQRDLRFESTFMLGRLNWGGVERNVFVSWVTRHPGLGGFLAKLQVSDGPSLVLVPHREVLAADVQNAHDKHNTVEVVGLDHVLDYAQAALNLSAAAKQSISAPTTGSIQTKQNAFCMAFTETGRRPVTLDEYRALVAKAPEMDLFLDLMSTVKRGNHPGSRRDLTGRRVEVALQPMAALALAMVVAAPNPLRERDFDLDTERAGRAFQEARKALDLQLEPRKWRSFPTLIGDVPAENRFAFTPPEELRFMVLTRLP